MDAPEPSDIAHYPKEGEVHYIFRKEITHSHLNVNLVPVCSTCKYLQERLPAPLWKTISDTEHLAEKYTLKGWDRMKLGSTPLGMPDGPVKVLTTGSVDLAAANDCSAGTEVDCWCVYEATGSGHISLLLQKVKPRELNKNVEESAAASSSDGK